MSRSTRARDYVRSLGRDRVTPRQKHILGELAELYSERYGSADFSNRQLADDVLISERHLGRILATLDEKGVIVYRPGRGAGNFSQVTFPTLTLRSEKMTETRQKPDTNPTSWDGAIRKENLNQNPEQDGLGLEVDSDSVHVARGFPPPSSSPRHKTANDDGVLPSSVMEVIRAFEASPITSGKASAADVATARRLLESYTPKEIKRAILLGSARKAVSMKNAEMFVNAGDQLGAATVVSGKIQSLAYFESVMAEAVKLSDSYVTYLQTAIRRFAPKKEPARATA